MHFAMSFEPLCLMGITLRFTSEAMSYIRPSFKRFPVFHFPDPLFSFCMHLCVGWILIIEIETQTFFCLNGSQQKLIVNDENLFAIDISTIIYTNLVENFSYLEVK